MGHADTLKAVKSGADLWVFKVGKKKTFVFVYGA